MKQAKKGFGAALALTLAISATSLLSASVMFGSTSAQEVDKVLDNEDKGVGKAGGWTYYPFAGYRGDLRFSGTHPDQPRPTKEAYFLWQFHNLPAGTYDVYATWVAMSGVATNTPYEILNLRTHLTSVTVNQSVSPTGEFYNGVPWQKLATVELTKQDTAKKQNKNSLRVKLTNQANGYVIADAIRIVKHETHGSADPEPEPESHPDPTPNTDPQPQPDPDAEPEPESESQAICGDGTVEGDEECDDGNTQNGDGCSATCTVEPPPTVKNLSIVTDEDQILDSSVVINANDHLTYSLVDETTNGTLVLKDDGSYVYTPSENFHGTDSFTYKGNNGVHDSNIATVTITVNSVNDVPQFASLVPRQNVKEGERITFTLEATDIDGDLLTFEITDKPENAKFNKFSGAFDWMPSFEQAGMYTMTAVANDGTDTSDPITVKITVDDVVQHHGVSNEHQLIVHDQRMELEPTTHRIVQSGNWSDPSIWKDGKTASHNSVVTIEEGVKVTYDAKSDTKIHTLKIFGELTFSRAKDTKLKVGTMIVYEEGSLEIGTEENPMLKNVDIVFADQPLVFEKDPSSLGNGLLGMGKVHIYGSPMGTTHGELAVSPKAGDTSITMLKKPSDWEKGDKIMIPDTRLLTNGQKKNDFVPQSEVVTIKSIENDGTIHLEETLVHDHIGMSAFEGVKHEAHVMNLTRNIVLRSENPEGTRGHTAFGHNADLVVAYAQFQDLGRTNREPLNDTKFDKHGNVTHRGTNERGRYSLHTHHLVGPEEPHPNGYQFTIQGNSILRSLKWGMVIHDSHYGLIRDNVVYKAQGAGITTEDGNEVGNVFEGNYVAEILGSNRPPYVRSTIKDFAHEGTGMWFRGGLNYVRNNVVASASRGAFVYAFIELGEKVDEDEIIKIPAYQGASAHIEGQYTIMKHTDMGVEEFDGNKAFNSEDGLVLWEVSAVGGGLSQAENFIEDTTPKSILTNFTAWNVYNAGVFARHSNNVTLRNFNIYTSAKPSLYGIYAKRSRTLRNLIVENADIRGFQKGIEIPNLQDRLQFGDNKATAHPVIITDSYLENKINILVHMGNIVDRPTTGIPPYLPTKKTVIYNTKFVPFDWNNQLKKAHNIQMVYTEGSKNGRGGNVVLNDEVYVMDYNGDPNADYRIYYKEQHPDFIVPQTEIHPDHGHEYMIGSPEAGLTNAENWSKYGLAVAGSIAPCVDTQCSNAVSVEKIDGLVFPIDPVDEPVFVETSLEPTFHALQPEQSLQIHVMTRGATKPLEALVVTKDYIDGMANVILSRSDVHDSMAHVKVPKHKGDYYIVIKPKQDSSLLGTVQHMVLPIEVMEVDHDSHDHSGHAH